MSDSVKGLERLGVSLQALVSSLEGRHLEGLLVEAVAPILADAQSKVPKQTGDLAEQLQITSSSSKHSAVAAVEVRDSAPGGEFHRAVFVEFGTSSQPARPFMRAAFELNKDAVAAKFSQGLSQLLKESK